MENEMRMFTTFLGILLITCASLYLLAHFVLYEYFRRKQRFLKQVSEIKNEED